MQCENNQWKWRLLLATWNSNEEANNTNLATSDDLFYTSIRPLVVTSLGHSTGFRSIIVFNSYENRPKQSDMSSSKE